MRPQAMSCGSRRAFSAPATVSTTHARELGIAYAIAGLCRALPYHATRRRLMLPADRLAASGVSVEDVFAGTAGKRLRPLLDDMARRARRSSRAQSRAVAFARSVLPALLPAAVVPLYLRALTRPGFDLFRDSAPRSASIAASSRCSAR